jgi:hypothetical protein
VEGCRGLQDLERLRDGREGTIEGKRKGGGESERENGWKEGEEERATGQSCLKVDESAEVILDKGFDGKV